MEFFFYYIPWIHSRYSQTAAENTHIDDERERSTYSDSAAHGSDNRFGRHTSSTSAILQSQIKAPTLLRLDREGEVSICAHHPWSLARVRNSRVRFWSESDDQGIFNRMAIRMDSFGSSDLAPPPPWEFPEAYEDYNDD